MKNPQQNFCIALFLIFSLAVQVFGTTINLEDLPKEEPVSSLPPAVENLQEKISKIQSSFLLKSEIILKNASLQIRKIEESSARQREDTHRDILEEEKIIIEETHFTDVEFLVKHCSSKRKEATVTMLQNSIGGTRTCVGLAEKKQDLQVGIFEETNEKFTQIEAALKKVQKRCNKTSDANCVYEKLYASNGPVINLYLRKNEAELVLENSEDNFQQVKKHLENCSDMVQENLKKDMDTIIDDFKVCCGTVVNRTKMLLKLLPIDLKNN